MIGDVLTARAVFPWVLAVLISLGCGDDSPADSCAFGRCEPGFGAVYSGDEGTLVSAWAGGVESGGAIAWAVGGPLGNGGEALALRFDGEAWARVPTGVTDSLWWVFGDDRGQALMVGERGLVLRWAGDRFTRESTDSSATLFGVWGARLDEAWAVGGSPAGDGPNDVVLRRDKGGWRAVQVPDPKGITFFKVWGSGPDDVWICGQRGWLLHHGPDGFSWHQLPKAAPLFTVSGTGPDDVWVVGGPPAVAYHQGPGVRGFVEVPLPGEAGQLNGVAASPGGEVFIVGVGGTKLRRDKTGWHDESRDAPRRDLHAVFADERGAAIVVGGDFIGETRPGVKRPGVLGVYRP